MNILIAADYSPPQSGAFGASVMELGVYLQEKGDHLVVILPRNQNTEPDDSWANWLRSCGITVCLWDKNWDPDEKEYLLRIIRENRIEILHLHFGMFLNTVRRNRRQFPKKVLVHDHMCFGKLDGKNYKERARLLAKSLAFRLLNIGMVSVGKEKDEVYAFAKHWYLPNGLPLCRQHITNETREMCRRRLGIGDEEKICLIFGWHCYIKGVDIVIRAIEDLNRRGENVVLGFVGIGEPPSKNRLEYIRNTTGVDPFVNWIRYLPSTEDIFAYHRMADVFVSASRGEGFSFATLEAISQNTPVVLSDIRSTQWAWKYSKTCVYKTESPEECAEAILKAIKMGRESSNLEEITSEFSIEKWCDGMYQIYQNC